MMTNTRTVNRSVLTMSTTGVDRNETKSDYSPGSHVRARSCRPRLSRRCQRVDVGSSCAHALEFRVGYMRYTPREIGKPWD